MIKQSCAVLLCIFIVAGCTSRSTIMAQNGSFRSQAVYDGVHRDAMNALSRENFETAKLNILLEAEKAKHGKTPETQLSIDAMAASSIDALKSFAKKRDHMLSWDRDHERANAYKYVTVDAKLFSEQGILNYIGSLFSEKSSKLLEAWDASSQTWKMEDAIGDAPAMISLPTDQSNSKLIVLGKNNLCIKPQSPITENMFVLLRNIDADIDVYYGDQLIQKIRNLRVGQLTVISSPTGEKYKLSMLDINEKSKTVRLEVNPF